jgi:hypothetical protein
MAGGASAPACAFKTLTRAMSYINGVGAAVGTKVVILGSASGTTNLASSETFPITVSANVTVTNSGGAVTVVLPNATNQAAPTTPYGFVLSNDSAGISGNTALSAPLVLDGNGNLSGSAISASGTGTVSVSNVTIENTRGRDMVVSKGTVNIGQGVVIKNAGITGQVRDGLDVTGGVVNISVPSGGTTTQFTSNTQRGIEVTGTGSVNVTGVAATTPVNGSGTVVTSFNGDAGIYIAQTPGGTGANCSINGLVSWGNNTYGGRFFGGSQVTVRNSVFGLSAQYGVLISAGTSGTNAQKLDTSKIDLGNTTTPGNNWLQFSTASGARNTSAGLCVGLGATATTKLLAAGNEWTTGAVGSPNLQTQANCATTAAALTTANNFAMTGGQSCNNGVAVGHTANSAVAAYVLNLCSCDHDNATAPFLCK